MELRAKRHRCSIARADGFGAGQGSLVELVWKARRVLRRNGRTKSETEEDRTRGCDEIGSYADLALSEVMVIRRGQLDSAEPGWVVGNSWRHTEHRRREVNGEGGREDGRGAECGGKHTILRSASTGEMVHE
jgi:hypothetical protein